MKKLSKTQPTVRIGVLAPKELADKFQEVVKDNYTSASNVLRKAMLEYIKENK